MTFFIILSNLHGSKRQNGLFINIPPTSFFFLKQREMESKFIIILYKKLYNIYIKYYNTLYKYTKVPSIYILY